MPRRAKRSREVIDLTEDDEVDTNGPSKRVASNAAHHVHGVPALKVPISTGIGGTNVYNTSAPQSSAVEPEHLDLTQEDEGPSKEFYGSLGLLIKPLIDLVYQLTHRRWQNCRSPILQWLCIAWRGRLVSQRTKQSGT